MLSAVEEKRLKISKATELGKKAKLCQFFTPEKIARFMAGLFAKKPDVTCRLLDAGAGIGSLSAAFLDRFVSGDLCFERVEIDAFEIDKAILSDLNATLKTYNNKGNINANIRNEDFIGAAADSICGNLFSEALPKYTHAILNPPYKKIRSDSKHRRALRQAGIETVNLYSAFVALSLVLLGNQGQLVAIIPRSFCNGLYYRPFRKFILQRAAIRHIHLFTSRKKAFKDDDVLQENVIVLLERNGRQGNVTITTSTDGKFDDIKSFVHPFTSIVLPDDSHHFIHIPTSLEKNAIELSKSIRFSLEDLGIMVSTGPVVDFRVREHLQKMPEADSVPLLYPIHFRQKSVEWPKSGSSKPNAIKRNSKTEKWLYPRGYYCVVRRFTSKEEKRRIVANVVNPDTFPDAKALGFENHLNVFHEGKKGLPKLLAYGLATFLNITAVDENFRRFNGHTQVNATDLRLIKYPNRKTLLKMGEWAIRCETQTQELIDQKLDLIDS